MLPRISSPLPADICPSGGGNQQSRLYEWVWKAAHVVYIIYSLEIGILLVWLPWLTFWENNYLLYLYPQFRPLVSNSFFKGFVVGLGIINIMIGIQELVRVRKIWKKGFVPQ